MEEQRRDNSGTPPWLIRIQENSWEAEIILSGLVLFSLIKAPGTLYNARVYFAQQILEFNDTWYFEATMRATIQFLTLGFIIHLVMRGIWIGFVGFSYAFPEGIRSTRLGFDDRYTRNMDDAWLVPTILRMERNCSMVFSTAMMFFLFVAGLAFLWFIFNWLLVRYFWYFLPWFLVEILQDAILIMAALYYVDLFTSGLLRRIPKVSAFFYPIYMVMRYPTLGFLYEKIYLTLISHLSRWKLALTMILAVFLAFASYRDIYGQFFKSTNVNTVNMNAYDNLRPAANRIYHATIQSDIIKDHTIRLFLGRSLWLDRRMGEQCDSDADLLYEEHDDELLACLGEFIMVFMDDQPYETLNWRFFQRSINERGYLVWINIRDLPPGEHILKVTYPYSEGKRRALEIIPFYREEPEK